MIYKEVLMPVKDVYFDNFKLLIMIQYILANDLKKKN